MSLLKLIVDIFDIKLPDSPTPEKMVEDRNTRFIEWFNKFSKELPEIIEQARRDGKQEVVFYWGGKKPDIPDEYKGIITEKNSPFMKWCEVRQISVTEVYLWKHISGIKLGIPYYLNGKEPF